MERPTLQDATALVVASKLHEISFLMMEAREVDADAVPTHRFRELLHTSTEPLEVSRGLLERSTQEPWFLSPKIYRQLLRARCQLLRQVTAVTTFISQRARRERVEPEVEAAVATTAF